MSTPQSNIHIVCLLTSQILYDIIGRRDAWVHGVCVDHLAEAYGLPSEGFFLFSLYINVSIFYLGKSYPVIHRLSVDNSVSANYNSMIKVNTSTVCKQQTVPE